jgi:tetratricopeptide (TPR) repeat protein
MREGVAAAHGFAVGVGMRLDLSHYLPKFAIDAPIRSHHRWPRRTVFAWIAGLGLAGLTILLALPALVSTHYRAAGEAMLAGDAASAAAEFQQSLRWSPNNPDLHRALARAYLSLSQPQQAIDALERAYRLRPESLLIRQELAQAYEAGGQVERADGLWAALGLSGNAMLAQGEQARRLKSYADAITWYQRAARAMPDAVEPLYYAGRAYRDARQLDQALQVLRQASAVASGNRDVWYELGQTHAARAEWQQALAAYERGLEVQGGQVGRSSLYYQIGYLRQTAVALRDIDAAENAYEQALALDDFQIEPHLKADTYYQKGMIEAARSHWAKATEEYQRALALNPRHYIGHVALADALLHMDQHEAAKTLLLQAIRLTPTRKEAYRSLGNLYRDIGDYAGAREMYSQILAIDAQDAAARKALEALP